MLKLFIGKKNIQFFFILGDIYLLKICQFPFGIIIEFYKSFLKKPNERRIPQAMPQTQRF